MVKRKGGDAQHLKEVYEKLVRDLLSTNRVTIRYPSGTDMEYINLDSMMYDDRSIEKGENSISATLAIYKDTDTREEKITKAVNKIKGIVYIANYLVDHLQKLSRGVGNVREKKVKPIISLIQSYLDNLERTQTADTGKILELDALLGYLFRVDNIYRISLYDIESTRASEYVKGKPPESILCPMPFNLTPKYIKDFQKPAYYHKCNPSFNINISSIPKKTRSINITFSTSFELLDSVAQVGSIFTDVPATDVLRSLEKNQLRSATLTVNRRNAPGAAYKYVPSELFNIGEGDNPLSTWATDEYGNIINIASRAANLLKEHGKQKPAARTVAKPRGIPSASAARPTAVPGATPARAARAARTTGWTVVPSASAARPTAVPGATPARATRWTAARATGPTGKTAAPPSYSDDDDRYIPLTDSFQEENDTGLYGEIKKLIEGLNVVELSEEEVIQLAAINDARIKMIYSKLRELLKEETGKIDIDIYIEKLQKSFKLNNGNKLNNGEIALIKAILDTTSKLEVNSEKLTLLIPYEYPKIRQALLNNHRTILQEALQNIDKSKFVNKYPGELIQNESLTDLEQILKNALIKNLEEQYASRNKLIDVYKKFILETTEGEKLAEDELLRQASEMYIKEGYKDVTKIFTKSIIDRELRELIEDLNIRTKGGKKKKILAVNRRKKNARNNKK